MRSHVCLSGCHRMPRLKSLRRRNSPGIGIIIKHLVSNFRFGKPIVSKDKNANQTHLALASPHDCCSPLSTKFAGDILMVDQGKCKFTAKANFAEAAGASAVLIINNERELYKMVCDPAETDLDIKVPAVMLPQDAGATLEKMLSNGSSVLCSDP